MSFRQHIIPPSPNPVRVTPTVRRQYTLVEKLRVANIALECGAFCRTAMANGVPPSTLTRWIAQRSVLQHRVAECKKSKRLNVFKVQPNRVAAFGKDIEEQLLDFYRERRTKAYCVTTRLLVARWRHIDPDGSREVSDNAARHRISRFMKRHGLVWRKKTHTAQKNNNDFQAKRDFVEYVKWKMEMLGITNPRAVANFDETCVYFSPAFERTITARGSRSVSIAQCNSSSRCTAMLGCTLDGHKLPPYVIFLGKPTPSGRIIQHLRNPFRYGYNNECEYNVQEKAWMDKRSMKDWILRVWKPYAASVEGQKLLLLDECPSHMTADVRAMIAETNTELDFIPGGYTSKLQVLDVGVNKPFKDRIRHESDLFLSANSSNNKPSRQIVSHWIASSWNDIPTSTIVNTWRHIGYTNETEQQPHPDPHNEEDNNQHDPLGLVDGDRLYETNDEAYNSDDSQDW